MATQEEKSIRLELPSTSNVECEIRESFSRDEYVITFFQNERQIKSSAVSGSKLTQDQMVDMLSDAGVEFFSFSAIFDVADLILTTIKNEFQDVGETEDTGAKQSLVKEPDISEELQVSEFGIIIDTGKEDPVTDQPEGKIAIDPGDKLLKKFKMSYSKGGSAAVYYCQDGNYAIVLFLKESPLVRQKFPKSEVNEDNVVAMISESGIDFLSFSAIYDSAEQIRNIILHPEEYSEPEKAEEASLGETEGKIHPEYSSLPISKVEEPEDEMVMVDLSVLDVSEYTSAKDFDKFIAKVTKFVNEGQPLPVKEIDIEKSGGIVCIILRQMDSWYVRFRQKSGSLSEMTQVRIDQDEIARVINQDIPRISFSYLYDASEKVFLAMRKLAERPMADIISNVAVSHFLQVIEKYEEDGDLKSAARVTAFLLQRFRREKNAKGILQFGKKSLFYLEEQKKTSKVVKLRNQLTEDLLKIDVETTVEFVLDSLETLASQEKFLIAANLSGLLLDHYLSDEEDFDQIKHITILARKQVDFYNKARLPVVMWENAIRYAHFIIKQLGKAGTDQITIEQRESYQDDIDFLLDHAFNVQEEQKANFELTESLENTVSLLKESGNKNLYSKYAEKLLISYSTQNDKNKALTLAKDCTLFLMDSENFLKACEFGNQGIKFFYELKKIEEAVDFSLEIVRGLIDLKETNAARDYLKFVVSLITKAYESDETKRIEKQLILGDLFGNLGLKDQAKVYIQAALQVIGDAKRREKIVLKHVDDLLVNRAVLTAQEMVNLELSRLLSGENFKEVIRFCQNFIKKLQEHNQTDLVFEYIKYITNLMIQTDQPDYKVLMGFLKGLQENNEIDRAAFIMDLLISSQVKQEDHTRAIDNINQFIEYLLEKSDRFDLVSTFLNKLAETYRGMGDPEGAVEKLINYQEKILDKSVDLAQKITDTVLKKLEEQEDFKKAIQVASRLIRKQIEEGRYQDAYIFSVQNARYYERLGDISKVIDYLEEVRDKFLEAERFEDANRMTDLILRFGRSHEKTKNVIPALKSYSKNALDRGDTETAAKFAIEMASLLEKERKGDKALEFLQMVFNTVYKDDEQSALKIFQRIIEIRGTHDTFEKIGSKYLLPLFQKYPDVRLIETTKSVINPSFEEYFTFSEKVFDSLLSMDEISEEIADATTNFVISIYNEGKGEEGDRIANKYANRLLNVEFISQSSKLMTTLLEKTSKPITEVLPTSFKYIKELISNSILEGAREFTDRIVKMITNEQRFGNEGRILAAKIAEKFSFYVASENPDLASEYAYQASNFYRSMNDFDGVVSVYSNLAKQLSSPQHAIRSFKRGIKICQKFKAGKHEARLLALLTENLILVKNATAIASFQQTLEKLEEIQDLDLLFKVAKDLIETCIEADNLKIAYSYLDYVTRLSTMINKPELVGGIIVFLLRHAEDEKDTKNLGVVQKYIDELKINPKDYKREYKELYEKRMVKLGDIYKKIDIDFTDDVEPVPELVKTSEIVISEQKPPSIISDQELAEEKIDEEYVGELKKFETPIESPIDKLQTVQEKILPSPDEFPTSETIEPITIEDQKIVGYPIPPLEVQSDQEISTKPESLSKDTPPSADIEGSKKGALSDHEISTLFSLSPSSIEEVPSKEDDVPLDDVPLDSVPQPVEEIAVDNKIIEEQRTALSESEVDSLFSKVESTEIRGYEKSNETEASQAVEEEWEVDAFGRLLKKDTVAPLSEESPELQIEKEKTLTEIPTDTPDLSHLQKFVVTDKDEKAEQPGRESIFIPHTDDKGIIPSIFDKKVPDSVSPAVKALIEDEKPELTDPFEVPEVAYKEITPVDETTDSQVKTPDLVDLFSDALSELSSISGEKGEADKDKKKRK
ncbi:MAG: tetratricopeptide repeat protein [Candidatus Hodarchaeales archaeon]|jgi:hypothetical protein